MSRNKLMAALLCVLLLTGCSLQPQSTTPTDPVEILPTKPAATYKTATVMQTSFDFTVNCNANFVYPNATNLLCEYDNAIVVEAAVFPERGTFSKGDVIATFRFDASPAELERLELEHYKSSSSVADQIATYEQRIEQYTQAAAAGGIDGQIAQKQLEKARNDLASYKEKSYATLAKQAEELEAYRELFEEKTLVAPEDGMVLEAFSIEAGTVLKKGAKLFTYTTGTPVLLRLNSPGKEFMLLATPGMPVLISRGNQEIQGTIVASPTGIADQLNNQYVYVDSPQLIDLEYRSYYKVSATILTLKDILVVKDDAIYYDENSTYVMLLENGAVIRREVMCGLSDNGYICILDGLEQGQQVILNY